MAFLWLPGRDPRLRPSIHGQHPFQTRRLRAAVVYSLVVPKAPTFTSSPVVPKAPLSFTSGDKR
jgi:hypothetical protein